MRGGGVDLSAGTPRLLRAMRMSITPVVASATYILASTINVAGQVPGASAKPFGDMAFALNPLNLRPDTLLRLEAWVTPNNVVPGVSMAFGLYPVTPGGTNVAPIISALGTLVPGSQVTITTGAMSASTPVDGHIDFPVPAKGLYAIGVINSGTTAANSTTDLQADLYAVPPS